MFLLASFTLASAQQQMAPVHRKQTQVSDGLIYLFIFGNSITSLKWLDILVHSVFRPKNSLFLEKIIYIFEILL